MPQQMGREAARGVKPEYELHRVTMALAIRTPNRYRPRLSAKEPGITMSHSLSTDPARLADAARSVRHVFIRDLALDAHVGVHRHEHGRTQPIRVNVDLAVAETAERVGDRLEDVVCYETIAGRIRTIVARGHVKLVETLAEYVAQACLEDPRVLSARVRIEKLAAVAGAASVGIEIERTRPEYAGPG